MWLLPKRGFLFLRIFVATVSDYCSKHANCPVLVIKRNKQDAPKDPIDDWVNSKAQEREQDDSPKDSMDDSISWWFDEVIFQSINVYNLIFDTKEWWYLIQLWNVYMNPLLKSDGVILFTSFVSCDTWP